MTSVMVVRVAKSLRTCCGFVGSMPGYLSQIDLPLGDVVDAHLMPARCLSFAVLETSRSFNGHFLSQGDDISRKASL